MKIKKQEKKKDRLSKLKLLDHVQRIEFIWVLNERLE